MATEYVEKSAEINPEARDKAEKFIERVNSK